jgi:hypothetical protein
MKINCHQCGATNDFGRVFCIKCGAKLDFETAERKVHTQRRTEKRGALWRLIRGFFLLGLLAAIGLILWPITPTGATGTPEQAAQFRAKILQLESAIAEERAASAEFSEAEVNAHLAQIVRYAQSQNPTQEVWELKLEGIHVALQPDQFVFLMTASRSPLMLSYEMVGSPVAGSKPMQLKISKVRWGHLPIPVPVSGWLTDRISLIVLSMTRERTVLEHSVCRLTQGKAQLNIPSP